MAKSSSYQVPAETPSWNFITLVSVAIIPTVPVVEQGLLSFGPLTALSQVQLESVRQGER